VQDAHGRHHPVHSGDRATLRKDALLAAEGALWPRTGRPGPGWPVGQHVDERWTTRSARGKTAATLWTSC